MDLFEYAKSKTLDQESPLASRLRPTTLDEVVGQQHIIGKNTLLYRAIKADKLTSVIFYGPPGTGKTTLAQVIANTTSAEFTQINATVAGKKDMEAVVKEAQQNLGMYGKKTILFIDEIHRFNKGQQDYLLPFVEDGTIILIGATTENPYFEVNAALISAGILNEPFRFLSSVAGTRGLIALMNFLMWFGNTTILLMAAVMGIDLSLFEAAEIDGCTPSQIFWKITMPLIRPILVYVMITSLIGGLQMFDVPQILTNGKGNPNNCATTMIMYLNSHMFSKNYGMAGAVSVILFIICAVLCVVIYRSTNEDEGRKKK